MIILPKLPLIVTIDADFAGWHTNECAVACQGQLMSIAFKLVLLLIGIWAVFGRRAVADLPRLFVARAALLALVFFVTFAYWLFYAVRIVHERSEDYAAVVAYAASLVDSLLFIHYLSVVLLELRHLRPEFKITIVRSPDGETRTISVGFLSIQRAAVDVLRCYYKDFPLFNPFLDKLPGGASRMRLKGGGGSQVSGFKLYNLGDGVSSVGDGAGISEVNAKALMLAASKRRESGHNERFYEELDWERRVRKRRCRLLAAADESFAHVKRVDEHNEKGW
jgi:vang-like